ncbi:RNA-directed DNA polymerase, eukaryota [Tanacetum coccineum]|uniref:RNA-directed DNA polymerase, eukaryota n=1 Tax=Tanacetum coccineum TaxID=301880 RepID=A0ABQ5EDJ2_9ASTR
MNTLPVRPMLVLNGERVCTVRPQRRMVPHFTYEGMKSARSIDEGREALPNGKKLAVISLYAPQELREKKMVWDYLILVLNNWNGEVVIMGDFNEVRTQKERHGSVFNAQGADAFNLFILTIGLHEVTDTNAMSKFMKKLKYLKEKIRMWVKANKDNSKSYKYGLKEDLDLDKLDVMELAQKAKIKWAIEGDENSNEFLSYFASRFDKPPEYRLHIDMDFPNKLSLDQQADLENNITREEIKKAVWDCGVDKSPGPDGFTFDFYRRYWTFLENDVVEVVLYFFNYGQFPKGSNSSFITLIPKTQEAKMMKDFRPITLIGSLYKIITKILAVRMGAVLEDLVDFEKAYDSVRWDYLDDILKSPTKKFQFHRGLKQGDPLSPFLFILIMESLHISMQRVVDAGLFRGIQVGHSLHVSHLFYTDDVVFMGHWSNSNIDTILRVLDCFFHASRLRINMLKSKLMGISVSSEKVEHAAKKIGCAILQVPFSYLGSKVGCLMSRIQSWNEIVNIILDRLSKWKMKTLSIGGRLTLLKSVLEGLGVSSFYALNRALLFKWVWRFRTQQSALWNNVIKGIHGEDGKLGKHVRNQQPSLWLDIVKEVHQLQSQGTDLLGFMHRKIGNVEDTRFWEDKWRGDNTFKSDYPRMYALETQKNVSVASKISHADILCSFRRAPRGGVKESQFFHLVKNVEGVTFVDMKDRWRWSLEGCGDFSVASVRKVLDDSLLPIISSKTRWIKAVPIKVNILAWKVRLDSLPTRLNISKRGMNI